MNANTRVKIEEIIGPIRESKLLDEQGCTSEVRRLITDHDSYIIKSSFKERYRNWLKDEAQVLEKLNGSRNISVPTYYGFIVEQESNHLIMSYEQGITLTTALKRAKNKEQKLSLVRSFGHFLQQLHEAKKVQAVSRHHNWLDTQLASAAFYLNRGETDGDSLLLKQLKDNKPEPMEQTMIHGDCTTDNVLVIDGKVRVFIDVASMTIGDPRYDVALAIRDFVDNEAYRAAFYDGYTRNKISLAEFRYFNDGLYEFF